MLLYAVVADAPDVVYPSPVSGGNLSVINGTYAEMFIFNETGGNVVIINDEDVFYNLTDFTQGETNDVLFNAGNSFIIQKEGVYAIDFSISFSGGGSDLYGVTVLKNNVPQNNLYIHRKLGASGDVGNAGGTGILTLNVGDIVNLAIEDEAAPAGADDATIDMANLRIEKIETRTVNGTTITNLNDLGDVDVSTQSEGDFLQYNGTGWENYDLFNDDLTFNGDIVFTEDVHGTAHVIQTGHNAQINMIKGVLNYFYWVDGVKFTNAPKGWTAEKDGSIIGISVTYDVVSSGGTGFPSLSFKTLINGATLGSASVGGPTAVGNQRTTRLTWARDTYAFSAGDNLQTIAFLQAFGGTPTMVIDSIIMTTRIVYDE